MKTRPKSEVICEVCKKPFMKENKQINRTNRNNGIHSCSRKCTNDYLSKKRVIPMSYNVRNARSLSKAKGIDFNLTNEYVQELFEQQDGKCAITKTQMTIVWKNNKKKIDQVSIDRLDNSKGYIEGNIHLVALGINYMRNTFSIFLVSCHEYPVFTKFLAEHLDFSRADSIKLAG